MSEHSADTETLTAVTEILSDLFGVERDELTRESSRESVEGWDSLQHVNLVLDLEARFDVQFSEDEVASMHTVGDIVDRLVAKGGGEA